MYRLPISSQTLLQYREDQLKIFKDLLRKAAKHPTSKRIHKMRVTIRRLNVVMSSRKLKNLAKVMGKDRDLDVAIGNAKHYKLGSRKLREAKDVARKKTKRALKSFKKKNLHANNDDQLLKTYKRRMSKLKKGLTEDQDLHQLRIKIKKVRYGLEAIGEFPSKLKKMQDLLGQVHDLEVLQKLKGKKKIIQKDKARATQEAKRSRASTLKLMQKMLGGLVAS